MPDSIDSSHILDLVKESRSVEDLYRKARSYGVKDMNDLVKGLEYQSYRLGNTARVEPVKLLGVIPAVKLRGADHINAGYLKRTAEELGDLAARKSRNSKLMAGAGLASLLALGLAAAYGGKKEDKYAKEVDKLMKTHKLITEN